MKLLAPAHCDVCNHVRQPHELEFKNRGAHHAPVCSTCASKIVCNVFEWEGTTIGDPFMDESRRFEVNPISYYGEAFLNAQTNDILLGLVGNFRLDESEIIAFYNNEFWSDEHG